MAATNKPASKDDWVRVVSFILLLLHLLNYTNDFEKREARIEIRPNSRFLLSTNQLINPSTLQLISPEKREARIEMPSFPMGKFQKQHSKIQFVGLVIHCLPSSQLINPPTLQLHGVISRNERREPRCSTPNYQLLIPPLYQSTNQPLNNSTTRSNFEKRETRIEMLYPNS
jgi:hypothetical protein